MIQEIIPSTEVTVVIKIYDHDVMDAKCMAYIEGDDYKGIVSQAATVGGALSKLSILLEAIDKYRINTNK